MKKFLFFLMLAALLLLPACKAVGSDESLGKSPDVPLPQWEYQWLTMRCSHDGGSGKVVCTDLATKDQTFLENLLNGMAVQGYELDEVMTLNDTHGLLQTFIFRRPFVVPEPQE